MTSVVLGVGDPAFGDRGVGPEVVRRLQRYALPDVACLVTDTWDAVQLAELRAVDWLVVIAAVTDGGPPGRIQMTVLERPRSTAPLAPGLILDPLVALLAMVGLPQRVIIYAVSAGNVSAGTGLTAPVGAVMDRLVALVAREAGERSRDSTRYDQSIGTDHRTGA